MRNNYNLILFQPNLCLKKGMIIKMINYQKDDFDGTLEDIMESVNNILKKTGKGYETTEEEDKNKSKAD